MFDGIKSFGFLLHETKLKELFDPLLQLQTTVSGNLSNLPKQQLSEELSLVSHAHSHAGRVIVILEGMKEVSS